MAKAEIISFADTTTAKDVAAALRQRADALDPPVTPPPPPSPPPSPPPPPTESPVGAIARNDTSQQIVANDGARWSVRAGEVWRETASAGAKVGYSAGVVQIEYMGAGRVRQTNGAGGQWDWINGEWTPVGTVVSPPPASPPPSPPPSTGGTIDMPRPTLPSGFRPVFSEDWSQGIRSTEWDIGDGSEGDNGLDYEASRASVANGVLTLRGDVVGGRFKAGQVSSKRVWKYGYFEWRSRILPGAAPGWVCCDWLRAKGDYPHGGEIDVMEQLTQNRNSMLSTVHAWINNARLLKNKSADVKDFANGQWWVVGCLWERNRCRFYVDGALFYDLETSQFEPDFQPMYAIINLWSVYATGWPHYAATGPCTFECDAFQVWQG